jgi:hypothetical protein
MKLPRRKFLHLAAVATALPTVARIARAQAYPTRPVTLIVYLPAGATPDIIARLIGQSLSRQFGQSVVIDNRPGAGGNLALQAVARALADGHTLLMVANPHAINDGASAGAAGHPSDRRCCPGLRGDRLARYWRAQGYPGRDCDEPTHRNKPLRSIERHLTTSHGLRLSAFQYRSRFAIRAGLSVLAFRSGRYRLRLSERQAAKIISCRLRLAAHHVSSHRFRCCGPRVVRGSALGRCAS